MLHAYGNNCLDLYFCWIWQTHNHGSDWPPSRVDHMADPLYFYTDPIGTERIISFSASTKQVSHLNKTNQSKLSVRGI